MVIASKFVYVSPFDGEPKHSDFEIQTEVLPELSEGDVLAEAVYWSVDPYMRVQMPTLPVNTPMIGEQIAKIIASKDPNFPVGVFVWGYFGWRNYTMFNNSQQKAGSIPPYIVEPIEDIPISTRLGVLGMTGVSAYFGFIDLCKPKANETVVISGAAGAVGSIVGQIAKIHNCRVIGITGSAEKCRWLQDELRFDAAINYKCENVKDALKTVAPNGVDVYFDNVGGELSSTIMDQMNTFGRISVCGSISQYNMKNEDLAKATVVQPIIVAKQLKIEGFIVTRWLDRWYEAVERLSTWIKSKQITYRETIVDGFENLPNTFIGMMRGENTGKALVKA